jgi:hypothetical protein
MSGCFQAHAAQPRRAAATNTQLLQQPKAAAALSCCSQKQLLLSMDCVEALKASLLIHALRKLVAQQDDLLELPAESA